MPDLVVGIRAHRRLVLSAAVDSLEDRKKSVLTFDCLKNENVSFLITTLAKEKTEGRAV